MEISAINVNGQSTSAVDIFFNAASFKSFVTFLDYDWKQPDYLFFSYV